MHKTHACEQGRPTWSIVLARAPVQFIAVSFPADEAFDRGFADLENRGDSSSSNENGVPTNVGRGSEQLVGTGGDGFEMFRLEMGLQRFRARPFFHER